MALGLAACGNDSQQAGTTGSPSTQPEQQKLEQQLDKQEENEE